jgi:hypothetical protein
MCWKRRSEGAREPSLQFEPHRVLVWTPYNHAILCSSSSAFWRLLNCHNGAQFSFWRAWYEIQVNLRGEALFTFILLAKVSAGRSSIDVGGLVVVKGDEVWQSQP